MPSTVRPSLGCSSRTLVGPWMESSPHLLDKHCSKSWSSKSLSFTASRSLSRSRAALRRDESSETHQAPGNLLRSREAPLIRGGPFPQRRKCEVSLRAQSSPTEPGDGASSLEQTSPDAAPAADDVREHKWGELAAWLFLAGFALGAPLDGLHSLVGLQVYDGPAAITIGSPVDGLLTSLWVPPLLGVMHVVVGLLQLGLDSSFPPPESTPAARATPVQMLIHLGVLIGLLRLSSLMYENNLPPLVILAVLLVLANGSWYSFDRTIPGYLLGLFVAICAPLSEIVCLKLGFWHYSTPDIYVAGEGLVSWTTCCYFFYTQWVASLARALDVALSPRSLLPPILEDEKEVERN